MNLSQIKTKSELLNLKFCELKLGISGSRVEGYIEEFYSSLSESGFNFKPHLWVSDEWFSPEGSCGIALPFYLFHPKLIRLEKKIMGEAEGSTKSDFMKLMWHEAGHAFDHAYGLMNKKITVRYFGSANKRYPSSYTPKKELTSYVSHLSVGYAQAHPSEDFAETFAICVKGRKYWERKYKNKLAFKKLEYMDQIVSKYKDREAPKKSQFILDPISKNTMTLGLYYKKKLNLMQKYERQGRILM